MAITLRNTKGSALTFAELDGNFSDLDTRVDGKLDSALTTQLIDSAYVNARSASGSLDSAEAIALIDSSYVQARTKTFYKYFYEADSGDTVFTGADLSGNTLAYDSSTIMVYKNGMLLHDLYDFTLSGKNTVTLTLAMDSGHDLIITTWN